MLNLLNKEGSTGLASIHLYMYNTQKHCLGFRPYITKSLNLIYIISDWLWGQKVPGKFSVKNPPKRFFLVGNAGNTLKFGAKKDDGGGGIYPPERHNRVERSILSQRYNLPVTLDHFFLQDSCPLLLLFFPPQLSLHMGFIIP